MIQVLYHGSLREGDDPEPWEFRDTPPVTDQHKLHELFGALPECAVASYLEAFGYAAAGPDTWAKDSAMKRPSLNLSLQSHAERDGHTWYRIGCHLTHPGRLHWSVERRLAHIRSFLHDPVKSELGTEYTKVFDREQAQFARRGAPPGTSDRLQGWFTALADSINSGIASPSLVALTLRFFEAETSTTRSARRSSDAREVAEENIHQTTGTGQMVSADEDISEWRVEVDDGDDQVAPLNPSTGIPHIAEPIGGVVSTEEVQISEFMQSEDGILEEI